MRQVSVWYPGIIHFERWDFPNYKPSSYWGTSIDGNPHMHLQPIGNHSCSRTWQLIIGWVTAPILMKSMSSHRPLPPQVPPGDRPIPVETYGASAGKIQDVIIDVLETRKQQSRKLWILLVLLVGLKFSEHLWCFHWPWSSRLMSRQGSDASSTYPQPGEAHGIGHWWQTCRNGLEESTHLNPIPTWRAPVLGQDVESEWSSCHLFHTISRMFSRLYHLYHFSVSEPHLVTKDPKFLRKVTKPGRRSVKNSSLTVLPPSSIIFWRFVSIWHNKNETFFSVQTFPIPGCAAVILSLSASLPIGAKLRPKPSNSGSRSVTFLGVGWGPQKSLQYSSISIGYIFNTPYII